MNDLHITSAIGPMQASAAATALLEQCRLPAEDLSTCPSLQLFGVFDGTALQGMIGLEPYPPAALLRSLAVAPEARGKGLGKLLVEFAERYARANGIETLYLLTTTAVSFFERLGYDRIDRDVAPAAIRTTAQFAGLCPTAATLMAKRLAA